MPTPAYLKAEGETQGPITQGAFTAESVGNVYQEGHEDEVMVQAVQHNVTRPTDPQSGQPTGSRVHRPMYITKTFDKSSPLFYNALTAGEKLTTCEIKYYRTSTAGVQEHYFTVKLEDATVVDIKAEMPHCQDPANGHLTHLETIALTYRKIDWVHEVAGTAGTDDWRVPKV